MTASCAKSDRRARATKALKCRVSVRQAQQKARARALVRLANLRRSAREVVAVLSRDRLVRKVPDDCGSGVFVAEVRRDDGCQLRLQMELAGRAIVVAGNRLCPKLSSRRRPALMPMCTARRTVRSFSAMPTYMCGLVVPDQ